MSYAIKVDYETGDSLSNLDEHDILEMRWESLESAKAALKRIEEHWRWYDSTEKIHINKKEVPEPEWHRGLRSKSTIKFKLDNGKEVQFYAPWCGYFERLYSAEIFSPDDNDGMKFIT